MTRFIDTGDGQAFIASADSRDTSPEILEAIAFFARNLDEAEAVWNGDGADVCGLTDIWEYVTDKGRLCATDFTWGSAGCNWFASAKLSW